MRPRTARFFQLLAYVRESRAIQFLILLAVVFLLLTLAVLQIPALSAADQHISHAFQRDQAAPLVALARFWTHAGDFRTLMLLGVPAAAFLSRRARPRAALLCVLTLFGHLLNVLLKAPIQRPRPDASIVTILLPAHGTSFPSGHAMATVMFYGFLALMAWVHLRQRRTRLGTTLLLALAPILVGLSRVYVGGHWLSDVIGGWTAGLFFLFVLAEVYKVVGAGELTPHGEAGQALPASPAESAAAKRVSPRP